MWGKKELPSEPLSFLVLRPHRRSIRSMSLTLGFGELGPNDAFACPAPGGKRAYFPRGGTRPTWISLAPFCYAKLEKDVGPKDGTVNTIGAGNIVIVSSCTLTGRKVVARAWGGSGVNRYIDYSPFGELFKWLADGRGTKINILILMTGSHRFPSDLGATFRNLAALQNLTLTIKASAPPGDQMEWIVVVNRDEPRVTFSHLAPGTLFNYVSCYDSTESFLHSSMLGDIAHVSTLVSGYLEEPPRPLFEQYDSQKWNPRLPIMSDNTRTLLSELREEIPSTHRVRVHSRLENPPLLDTIDSATKEKLRQIIVKGAFCTVCGKKDECEPCTFCIGGDSYCSARHKMLDWPHHKEWFVVSRSSCSAELNLTGARRCKKNRPMP